LTTVSPRRRAALYTLQPRSSENAGGGPEGLESYVDRILRGEKPGDLPVQLPVKYEMAVNRKTAKALGLAIPPSIMLRADEVIK
jgi:hypothetical protein